MDYGLIGVTLGHSFSKEIHESDGLYSYELKEIPKDKLGDFFNSRSFKAINVTIPYKEQVLQYLDGIDDKAKSIGAVNVIVNRDGKLFGYNTDYDGFYDLAKKSGVDFRNKNILILGNGGASKAVRAVASDRGAKIIDNAVRRPSEGCLLYHDLKDRYDIIVNATPVGTFPDEEGVLIDLEKFKRTETVLDLVYNPLRPHLVVEAKNRGLKSDGGLYMLVSQAVRSREIFLGAEFSEKDILNEINKFYSKIIRQKTNIVLCGMPSCGKTSVGKELSRITGRPFIDTDSQIKQSTGKSVAKFIEENGIQRFREEEKKVIKDISMFQGRIIATGGGSVLDKENVDRLKRNGILIYLDTRPENLVPTPDRPLSSTTEALFRLFEERNPIYMDCCDYIIENNHPEGVVANIISEKFNLTRS